MAQELSATACTSTTRIGSPYYEEGDAIATDHAPHTAVDKDVEFGAARPGIAGIETALGILLELVAADLLPLAHAKPEGERVIQGALDQPLLLAQLGLYTLKRTPGLLRPVGLSRLQALLLQAQAQACLL